MSDIDIGKQGGISYKLLDQIARIDERTKITQNDIGEIKKNVVDLQTKIEERISTQNKEHEETYARKDELDPIKKIVYGFVGFILLVMGGMGVTVIVRAGVAPPPTSASSITSGQH